jgi:hypothetical protein
MFFYGTSVEKFATELDPEMTGYVVEGTEVFDVIIGEYPNTDIKRFIRPLSGDPIEVEPGTILRSPVRLDLCNGSEDGWTLGSTGEREEDTDISRKVIGWSEELLTRQIERYGEIYEVWDNARKYAWIVSAFGPKEGN